MGYAMAESVQEDLLPIGVLDGVLIYPIFGAEPKPHDPEDENDPPGGDPDEDDDEDDEDDSDEDDEDDDEDDKSKKKSKKKSKDEDDEDDDESEDEDVVFWKNKAGRLQRQKEAADRRATEAERENRKLKQSKDDLLDGPGKQELQDAKNEAKQASSTVTSLRLQIALLSDRSFEWHDPADVLKALADDDQVEIDDETGRVIGVKKALARLARQKPYLVKTTTKRVNREEDDDDDEEETPRRRPSGAQSGTRRNGAKAKASERAKIVTKYPILSRR